MGEWLFDADSIASSYSNIQLKLLLLLEHATGSFLGRRARALGFSISNGSAAPCIC